MSLLIVLPSEWDILSRRRAIDVEKNQPIMHAIDSDVFAYLCRKPLWHQDKLVCNQKLAIHALPWH
jgi:hypothetical protein